MSITSDIRSYADTAVSQGKQVLDQAQAQLDHVSGQANDFVGKARDNVSDIADKAVNLDAITTAVEPYLAQLKEYSTIVTDKFEGIVAGVRSDKRVSKLVDRAESVTGAVVETVNERVLKPVQSLTGIGAKQAPAQVRKPAPKPRPSAAAKPARKPAATKPASKPTARKAPAKRTPKG